MLLAKWIIDKNIHLEKKNGKMLSFPNLYERWKTILKKFASGISVLCWYFPRIRSCRNAVRLLTGEQNNSTATITGNLSPISF
jgi:hypothetical protein